MKFRWLIIFLCSFFFSFRAVVEPDFGWHLVTGQQIITTSSIPRVDVYSYSLPGHPFTAHSWLLEVMLATFYHSFGLWGVSILYSSLFSIGIVAFAVSIRKQLRQSWLLLTLSLLIPFTLNFLFLRTHLVTFTGLALIQLFFSQLEITSTKQTFANWLKTSKAFLIPLLFLFWTNLHAGFLLGLVFFGLHWLFQISIRFWQQKQIGLIKSDSYIFIVLFASGFVTVFNPYGFQVFELISTMLTNTSSATYNTDWLPLFSPRINGSIWSRLLLVIVTLLVLTHKRIDIKQKLFIGLFLLLSLKTIRYALPLFVVLLPNLIILVDTYLEKIDLISFQKKGLIGLLALIVLVQQVMTINQAVCAYSDPACFASQQDYPYQAVEYLKQNQLGTNLFNHYTWGGYLIWQLPEYNVFIDGRMDNFFVNDQAFIQEFADIVELKPDWEETLLAYETETILIPLQWLINEKLLASERWEQVYIDELSAVYIRSKDSTPE